MMAEHVCEWTMYKGLGATCKCGEVLDYQETNRRLNEYDKLKRATERLSAEEARQLAASVTPITDEAHRLVLCGYAYADILEGK